MFMKKIFSILCALTIVLSASAVPAKTLGLSKQKEAVEVKTVKAHKTLPATRFEKATRAAVAFKAPQAKLENYDVTIVDYAENFYTTDNDVWVKLYDADENVYYFDVVVAEGTNELVLGQTYTLADMIANYSYMRGADGKMAYASASLTKTLVAYEEQQLVHFDAAFTDTLGNNYTLVYQEAPFIITGDTIDVNFTTIMNKPVFAQGMCQLSASNDSWEIAFTFNVADEGVAVGTYGPDDMNLQYTYVNDLEAKEAHCVVTENNGRIDLEGWILAKDGNVYHVTMFFETPTVQSQVTITASNLVLDDTYASYFGIIIASASNEDYSVSAYLSADDYLGTFGADEIELTIEDAEGEIDLFDGTVTIANTADGIVITGTALSMDGVEFTLNLSYVVPEATSQENLSLSGTLTDIQGQAWQFMGQTSDKYVTIAAYSTSIPGTYGRADLAADYTYVVKFVGADTLYYDMVDANIVVAISGTNATITGTLKGQNYYDSSDVIEFTLNLTATVEEYEEQGNQYDAQDAGFYYNFPVYTIDDQYLAQYNVLVAEATDAENNTISLEFNVEAGATGLAAGVYAVDDSGNPGTVSAGSVDQYIYGSFAGSLDAEGYINVPLWLIVEGTVTVTESGVIEVAATNTWGQRISSRLGEYPESIDNVDANATVTKAIRNGQLLIIKNGVKYNAQGTILK